MSRATIILNPAAGAFARSVTAAQISNAFSDLPIDVTIVTAAGRDIATATRRALSDGSATIVAAGGDGTVNAMAAIVTGTEAALGVLPLGTLNHFAKDLGVPLAIADAARTIARGRVALVDVADVNGHVFVNNSSVGLYPRLVWERIHEQRRGRRKSLAMLLAIARVWRRYRRVSVSVAHGAGERIVHTPFVFVGNNEYLLEGVRLGGRTRLDEGCLHVCMAPGLGKLEVAGVLVAALCGHLRGIDRFESIKTTGFSISARRRHLGVTADGELLVLKTPLLYHVRPHALRVIVPHSLDRRS
jgi:diacylglycerol kinase family enzyme